MSTRMRFRRAALAVAAALALAACGGGGDEAPTEDPDVGQSAEEEDAPADDAADDEPAEDEAADDEAADDDVADDDVAEEDVEAPTGGTITLTVEGEAMEFIVTECAVDTGTTLLSITAEAADGATVLNLARDDVSLLADAPSDSINVTRDGSESVYFYLDDRTATEVQTESLVLFDVDGTSIEGSDIPLHNSEGEVVTASISGSCG